MQIGILSREQITRNSILIRLRLPKQDFCLFGFLLESAEGLGIHSFNAQTGGVDVLTTNDLIPEMTDFLSALTGT
ncbi:MAG TPA: hypothetical protein P5533_06385 [Candidatus Cloacimonadota bacterium]|nr:hypothetical protein [Candidatus Cloacimonadota bacterium]